MAPVYSAERQRALEDRERRVDAALRGGQLAAAVKQSLADPPFASKDANIKSRSHALVMRALTAAAQREGELTAALGDLSLDEADHLMKYVYRGLSTPESSAMLLKIHAMIVERCGQGVCPRRSAVG
jgi:hypothetical protein